MHNFILMLVQYFSSKADKIYGVICGLFMYVYSLFTVDFIVRMNISLTWKYCLSTFLGLSYIFIGAMVGVAGKNFYTWMEPKVLKFSKELIFKLKNKGNGKRNNSKAA